MISRLIPLQGGDSSGVSKTKRVMNLGRRKMQALINLVPNTRLTALCFHMLFIFIQTKQAMGRAGSALMREMNAQINFNQLRGVSTATQIEHLVFHFLSILQR
jgi:TRAP-type mannitol/chloroaromatic compound transport system permease large subunit